MNITATIHTDCEKWKLNPYFSTPLSVFESHKTTYQLSKHARLDCILENRNPTPDELQVTFHFTLSFSSN